MATKFGNSLNDRRNQGTKRFWFYFALILSIINACLITSAVFTEFFLFEMILGWSIALLNFGTNAIIKKRTANRPADDSLIFAMKWGYIKLILLIIIIGFLLYEKSVHNPSFLLSFFMAYFTWMIYDVLVLHITSLNEGNKK